MMAATALFAACQLAHAQEDLAGSYNGSYLTKTGRIQQIAVALEITTIEGGKVTGKYTQSAGQCRGEFALGGTYAGGELNMLASGGTAACPTRRISLKPDGGKLIGKIGDTEITLSK